MAAEWKFESTAPPWVTAFLSTKQLKVRIKLVGAVYVLEELCLEGFFIPSLDELVRYLPARGYSGSLLMFLMELKDLPYCKAVTTDPAAKLIKLMNYGGELIGEKQIVISDMNTGRVKGDGWGGCCH
jgi:hypothetical protein